MSDYEQELDFVKNAEDSLFPDFLYNPLFNDFDDEYYSKSFANDALLASVKKLRRKYNDFFDYMDAMDTYQEYMNSLVEKYGSMKVIKNAMKVGTLPEAVPTKPKLKNNRKNRQIIRSGIIPSRKMKVPPLPSDEILVIARQAFPDQMGEEIDETESMRKPSKKMQRKLREMTENISASERRKNLYRSTGSNSGTDFIVEYLNQAKQGVYDRSGNYTGNADDRSLMEIVREEERIANTRPELLEDPLDNSTMIINGRLVKRSDSVRMQVYKELFSAGYDIIGMVGNKMDKKSVKMIRSQIGDTEPATKKEMKKIAKRAKKDRERLQKRRDSNALLEKTLLGNKVSFDSDDGSLSFRLKDIYRD